ncbi:MAG TPA: DUF4397 domain-containing protein [Ktedonobacteraceae bacterium]
MRMKKMRRLSVGLALFLCSMFALISFFLFPVTTARAATPAFVRIIHASPFVATADVFVDGSPFLTSFAFGAIAGYAPVPAGSHKVQIALAGKGPTGAALTQVLAVQPGGVYTVAATGTRPTNLALKVFVDSNLFTNGMSKVRVYQLTPDGGWMDVLDGGKLMAGADYQNATGYLTLAPGATMFTLKSESMSRTLSLSTTLQANFVTSVFSIGMFAGEPKAQLVIAQTAALPGLPQTGSDPAPVLSSGGQLDMPWLLLALAVVLVGGTLFTRRLFAH